MARPSFLRRTARQVLRGTSWLKSVNRYNERFPQIFRADKWRPATEGSLWMNLFGFRTSTLSLVGNRRRGRNNLQRLLRVESLEAKQLLAANVAVLDTGDDVAFQAIVDQLNNNTQGLGLTATLVQATDIDEASELAAFDVVVIGDDGTDPSPVSFDSKLASALSLWAQDSNGGIVTVGLGVFGIRGEAEEATLDAIIPVNVAGGAAYDGPGSLIDINATVHDVTAGVADITVTGAPLQNFTEAPAADAWGTVLATSPNGAAVVAGVIPSGSDPGRSVYLGPVYSGSRTLYTDADQWESGDGDRLLEQAVNWAGNVVAPPNTPPVADDQSVSTTVDTKVTGTATATDAESDPLTFALGTAPVSGIATVDSSGNFTYTPNSGFIGSDSFTFTVDDPGPGGPDTGTINVTVNPASPVATASISVADGLAGEPNEDGKFLVSLSAAQLTDTNITYSALGTATNGVDYTAVSGFLTIPAGQTSGFIDIDVIDDTTQEGTETVTIALNTASGSVTIDSAADDATINLTDNDPAPPPDSISAGISDAIAGEPADDGAFSVTLSKVSGVDTKVNFSLTGSAISGADYQPLELNVVIPAGQTTATVPIDIIDDTANEGPETVVFTLLSTNNPGFIINPGAADATITITDNDSVPASNITVTANDSAAAEVLVPPGTANPGSFRISISPVSATATTVNYTISGTAVNGADYATITNTAIIPANTAFVDIPINVTDDAVVEGNETVIITLTSSSGTPGAVVDLTPATVTISDNDASQVTIVPSDPTAGEPGNNGAFTVSINPQSTTATTINLSISGTATNGADYASIPNTVIIPANTSSVVIPVTVADDAANEAMETVIVTITGTSNPGIGIGSPNSATVTIADNENDPVVANDDSYSVLENKTLTVNPPGVLGNDVDPDGDPLQAALLSTTTNGSLAFLSNGGFTYTPNPGFEGKDKFTYRVFDGTGFFDDAEVTIIVNNVNNNPTAVDDSFTTTRGNPVTGNVLVNDTDPDGDAPLFTGLATAPANGSVVLQSNGTFTYTPNTNVPVPPSKEATDFFEYLLSDGKGGTDIGRVDIKITAPTNIDATDDIFTAPEDFVITSISSVPQPRVLVSNLLANDVDPENDAPFTLVSTTAPTSGSLFTDAQGNFIYTPFQDFFGTDSFTYTIQDSKGFSDTAKVTINLTAVNDVRAQDDTYSVQEGNTLNVGAPGVLANDFDPELNNPNAPASHKLAITGVTAAAGDSVAPFTGTTAKGGNITVQTNGSFTYIPANNFSGTDTFTYEIRDAGPDGVPGNGDDAVDTATVTINVGGENDRPDAVNDPANGSTGDNANRIFVPEDDPGFFIDVLRNDTDADGDKLFVVTVTAPLHGTISIVPGAFDPAHPNDPHGGVRYTPNPNYFGPDEFTYRVSDGRGANNSTSDPATVFVFVNDQPDVASPVDDTFNATEDATITLTEAQLLGNDFNPNASPITILALNDQKNHVGGKAVILPNGPDGIPGNADDRSVRFTPNANFTGAASFQYTISGNGAKSDDFAVVTINYSPVNDPPTVVTDNFDTPINTAITVTTGQLLANDSDVEGGALSVVGVSNPLNGTVSFNQSTGQITFTPTPGFTSSVGNPAGFNYTVSDSQGGFTTGQVVISVQFPNRPPVANDELIRTVDEVGPDNNNHNRSTRIEFNKNELLSNDTDPDGDSLTFDSLVAGSAIGGTVSLVSDNNVVRFDTTTNFVGDASFEYKIRDGRGGFDIGKATIRVKDTNDPPDARNDTAEAPEDTKIDINVLLNDTDADFGNATGAQFDEPTKHPTTNADLPAPEQLRVVAVSAAANGFATIGVGGIVSYTPNEDFNGTDSFSYTIADLGADNIAGTSDDATDTATVTITVGEANDVIARNDGSPSDRIKINEDSIRNAINVLANDSDPEGDTFKITSVVQGAHGVVEIGLNGGNVLYTPDPDFSGPDQFTYTVTDALGATDSATVFVVVNDQGEAPNAANDTATVIEDSGPNIIDVRANDTDGETPPLTSPPPNDVRIVSVTQGANGTVQIRQQPDGKGGLDVVYIPNLNFSGIDSFTYTLRDPDGNTDTATVNVTVVARPDPPDAANDIALVDEGSKNTPILVLANDTDPDGDALTVVNVTTPANGTATIAPDGKSVLYTPNPGFSGDDVFQYTARDPSGFIDSATVLVTVRDIGPAFIGTPGNDVYYVRTNPAGTTVEVFASATPTGVPVFTAPQASITPFSFDLLGGDDRVIIDVSNGDPLPLPGIEYKGGAGNDTLEIRDIGTTQAVYMPSGTTTGDGKLQLGTGFVNFFGVEPIDVTGLQSLRTITPNASDTLNLTSPAVNTTRFNGFSGGVSLSPVTFRDVGTFIIDAAANDAGGGDDSLTASPGAARLIPNGVGFMEFRSGTGANSVNITNGSARLDSTVALGGTLNTTVAAGAELVTNRFRQNSLTLQGNAKATVVQAGTLDAVSRLNSLVMDTAGKLDLNDNSLVIDYAPTDAATVQTALDAIHNLIRTGRGGPGIGNGTWTGTGITSAAAAAANALNPESRSIGFANNGTLPLGPYTSWRGQAVDTSSFLIGFTRTGDATLDSVVDDNDVTILGATFGSTGGRWALGDFDYTGTIGDDDATLLGAFYNPGAAAFPAPLPPAAPLAAAGEAFFASIASDDSGSSNVSSGANVSAADLAAIADQIFAEEDAVANRKSKYGV